MSVYFSLVLFDPVVIIIETVFVHVHVHFLVVNEIDADVYDADPYEFSKLPNLYSS